MRVSNEDRSPIGIIGSRTYSEAQATDQSSASSVFARCCPDARTAKRKLLSALPPTYRIPKQRQRTRVRINKPTLAARLSMSLRRELKTRAKRWSLLNLGQRSAYHALGLRFPRWTPRPPLRCSRHKRRSGMRSLKAKRRTMQNAGSSGTNLISDTFDASAVLARFGRQKRRRGGIGRRAGLKIQ